RSYCHCMSVSVLMSESEKSKMTGTIRQQSSPPTPIGCGKVSEATEPWKPNQFRFLRQRGQRVRWRWNFGGADAVLPSGSGSLAISQFSIISHHNMERRRTYNYKEPPGLELLMSTRRLY